MATKHIYSNTNQHAEHVDNHIGTRMKERRLELELALEAVAAAIGLSPEDYARIEGGQLRAGAERLARFAEITGTPVATLFDGLSRAAADMR